jgi:alpha-tubulin suppressor-like RCC1 family protein
VSAPSAPLVDLGTDNLLVTSNDELGRGYTLKSSGASAVLFDEGGPVLGAPKRLLTFAFTDFVDARYGYTDVGLLPPSAGGKVVLFSLHDDANDCGVFGDGTTSTPTTGVPVAVPSLTATAISSWGDDYNPCRSTFCAIQPSGVLACWGSNDSGQAGYDTAPPTDTVMTPTPVTIPGVTQPIVSVAVGSDFTCATDGPAGTGQVYCWGANDYGQLGLEPQTDYTYTTATPAPVLGINNNGGTVAAKGVTANETHVCAWLVDGTAMCWGGNDYGQLGDGSFDDASVPGVVLGLKDVAQMSAGPTHTCALRNVGTVACWGSSYYGQVGTGKLGTEPATPMPRMVMNLP